MGVFFFFLEGSVEGKIREKRRERHTQHTDTTIGGERKRKDRSNDCGFFSKTVIFYSFLLIESNPHIHIHSHTDTTHTLRSRFCSARLGSARAPTRASVCGVIGVAMPMPVWLNLTRKGQEMMRFDFLA